LPATIEEIDIAQLDALMGRLKDAKDFDLTLSSDDIQLLLKALSTLTLMQSRLSSNDVTLHKLRKLLGIVVSSEKLGKLINGVDGNATSDDDDTEKKKKKRKPPKSTAKNTIKPEVVHHPLDDLTKGDRCPACDIGTLSKYDPASLIRITGSSPYTAIQHVHERLRCNACGEYFTAPLPEEVLADGDAGQKYGYTARAMMGIGKYFMGSPFYRQSTLQDILHMPISASTVFDQCEKLADSIFMIYKTLICFAANAVHFHLDDTTHQIIDQKEIIKPQRKTKKPTRRTGTYASGLIATLEEGNDITLFQTNIGHAGEWIDEVLEKRETDRQPPIIMSDALSCNKPSEVNVIESLCNVHARRQFVDILEHYPAEVEYVLNLYKIIWTNEKNVTEQALNPEQRQVYHHEHSLPVMEKILDWGKQALDTEKVEENSGMGKAIRYFIKHYSSLTCFCKIAGAKIDNNWIEAQLKIIVRGRKNASFYKTQHGANVSDVVTSVIATCINGGVNPLDYLVAIQRNQVNVNASPEKWLPWNYHLNA